MKKLFYIVLFLLAGACTESFDLSPTDDFNALVVDGRITNEEGFHTVRLSYTTPINDFNIFRPATRASVTLEELDGPSVNLPMVDLGVYSVSTSVFPVQEGRSYRLRVQLQDRREYESPWELMRPAPEIDDLRAGFETKGGKNGMQLYLDTQDDTGVSEYFRWEVIETWKFKSPYASRLLWEEIQLKPLEDFHETCWITSSRKNIMISSVNNQSENAVVNHPLVFVSPDSARLDDKYSVLVKQYSISLEEFTFWDGLKRTNEDVGGLYDSQPFQLVGNMKSMLDEEETVFGYFSVSAVSERRISIDRDDFPEDFLPAKTLADCPLIDLSLATPEVIGFYLGNGIYLYVFGTNFTTPECGDCEKYGGTTVQPDFWEE